MLYLPFLIYVLHYQEGLNFLEANNILLGTFKANPIYAVIGPAGIVLAAVYMLWMVQRVFFGECKNEENKKLLDLNFREIVITVPLIILIFWLGIYPKPFIEKIEPTIDKIIAQVQQKSAACLEIEDSVEIMKDIENGGKIWDSTGH